MLARAHGRNYERQRKIQRAITGGLSEPGRDRVIRGGEKEKDDAIRKEVSSRI